MKIQGMPAPYLSLNSVKDRPDGDRSGNQHPKNDSSQSDSDQTKSDEKNSNPASFAEVSEAVESYQSDLATSGLTVDVEGKGPGLKVVLRDQEGLMVRTLSGEEFVRLRQSTSKVGTTCGKILDRKL